MAANDTVAEFDDHYMIGPTSKIRITTQTILLSILLIFGILSNGTMVILFTRFKSLRRVTNYFLIDLTIVEFLDTVVNIPIFMEFFLLTKKRNLSRQTRWYAMLLHRFFLLNDLFTQLALIVDCFLAIKFGKRFTAKKSSWNVKVVIASKWAVILALLLAFSIPNYSSEDEHVSDEAYQRLLFGPNQIIWKIVIPSCQAIAIVTILMTNKLIKNSRNMVFKRYGMRVFGKSSKNSSKAINTLKLIMVVQTLCKVPASAYSYVAVDDRIEGNRWFAFFSYFFLFMSSSVMPVIYFCRTVAFRRAIRQFKKHPFARNAYLDYAAQYGYKTYRNGRLHLDKTTMRRNERLFPMFKGDYKTSNEPTKDTHTDLSSRTTTQNTSRPLSMATEVSAILENVGFAEEVTMELTDLAAQKRRTNYGTRRKVSPGTEVQDKKEIEICDGVRVKAEKMDDSLSLGLSSATSATGKGETDMWKAVDRRIAECGYEERTLNDEGDMEKKENLNGNGESIPTTNKEDISELVGTNTTCRRICNLSEEYVQKESGDNDEEQVGVRITHDENPVQEIKVSDEEEDSILVIVNVQGKIHREGSSVAVEEISFDNSYENLAFDTKL